ncbi:Beta-galactosidase [Arcticibacter svalbardensis MN12-7]|uniref:Beta-galactosidase n=1 Tax=Arcticibacter svalbardensis MN12-7 TaxID=1150600 RepID=R9GSP9_9SPHI|nr:hypothetical protein [Arcticibacter svalbardensis]EOR94575.1 Beta-galactosidase [Arcticibacter svalbardensis MN12-7]
MDLHNYPEPAIPRPEIFGAKHALVLGEFGGLGLLVDNHVWQQKDNWGYQSFKKADDKKLGWAEGIGFNTMRVYLHSIAWKR